MQLIAAWRPQHCPMRGWRIFEQGLRQRRSILITSNLVFGEWDRIFKNPMTTAAAIDRLVHHSAILEFHVSSYRTEDAKTASVNSPNSKPNGGSSKRRPQPQATR